MAYLLDANTFIDAKNRYYDFAVCPAFWAWIDQQIAAGTVVSIERVGNELLAGNDDLATWAANRGAQLFLPPDPPVVTSLQQVAGWANASQYRPAGINEFLQNADSYLVAHAHAHGHIVVTHERIDQGVKRIKIPAACAAMNVQCMNPFEMLRLEHATFVLGART
jgi:predicted nucleic acid-binding protein